MILASELAGTGTNEPVWVWLVFLAFIGALLAIDLLVVHRTASEPSTRRALVETAVWISIGLSFSLVVLAWKGGASTTEYLSAYLIEKSLSIDNVFVWAIILDHFAVPRAHRHRVLFWGVFGALAMRFVFIVAGVALLERFEWLTVIFGVVLIVTAIRLLRGGDEHIDPSGSRAMRLVRRFVPMTSEFRDDRLWVRDAGRWIATPLFAVLVLVEVTDLVFAVDSIPAVLAVSRDAFIVFSSNAFAILGLRALYFVLSELEGRFAYLEQGIVVILVFVGVKMLAHPWVELPTWVSLAVIAGVLASAVLLSERNRNRTAQLDVGDP